MSKLGPAVGAIPSKWQTALVGDLCLPIRRVLTFSDPEAQRRPYLGLEQIESGTGLISFSSSDMDGKSATFAFGAKDVLYGKLRPYLNKVAEPDFEGRCSTELIPLRPRPGVDRGFLAWLLRRPETIAVAMQHKTGSRMPRADMKAVFSMRVDVPSETEQRVIAVRLNEQHRVLEQAMTSARQRLSHVDAIRGAVLRRAFKGIVPLSVGDQNTVAPEGWTWKLLSTIARLESGHTPSRHRPDWWDGDIPWLALPDIRSVDGQVVLETIEHTNPEGISNSSARILPAGTVCLSRTASVGFVTVLGRPMATSQDFVNWVCGPELEASFLAYLLQRSRNYIRSLSSGAVHKTVYMPTVKAFRVCVPDRACQGAVVRWLDDELAAQARLETTSRQTLSVLERLPSALLRSEFNGGA